MGRLKHKNTMKCPKCKGLMIYSREPGNTFGPATWIDIYHCINCGEIFDPEITKNERYIKIIDSETGEISYATLH